MDTAVGNQLDELVQLVSFRLGEEQFAVAILKVQEINHMVDITKLPETPPYCEGVINLRGQVIPILNLRKRFEMEHKEWDKDTRIIVCVVNDSPVGMVVDSVDEVLTLDSSTIEPAPGIISSCNAEYITGVAKLDERLLIFLDISLIASDANEAMKSITESSKPQMNLKTDNSTNATLSVDSKAGFERKVNMNSIETIINRLREVTRELDANTDALKSAAREVVSCAQTTVKAAEHMSELTGRQAQSSQQVSVTAEETIIAFTDAWNTSNDRTGKLAEMIKTIQTETESARQSMQAGIEVVFKGREMADKADTSLTEAVNLSREAMGVLELIEPASGKTKATVKKKRVKEACPA